MCCPRVLEWHKHFLERRESVKDDDRPGRPRTSVTVNNTQKVRDVIRKNRRFGVLAVSEMVNLDRKAFTAF
jgi:hypothetical protein